MKIGLLLGSFDPIHIGHLNLISCALNSNICDKVLVVVANHNPWKKNAPVPFEIRCQMVNSSIEPFGDKCEVCKFEEEFTPPVYSYLPIGKILETYPNDEIYLIGGSDTINKVPKWRNFETHIKNKIGYVEIVRYDKETKECLTNNEEYLKPLEINKEKEYGIKKYFRIFPKKIDLSSTIIRNMINKGMNPYPLITNSVYQIIIKNNLYF